MAFRSRLAGLVGLSGLVGLAGLSGRPYFSDCPDLPRVFGFTGQARSEVAGQTRPSVLARIFGPTPPTYASHTDLPGLFIISGLVGGSLASATLASASLAASPGVTGLVGVAGVAGVAGLTGLAGLAALQEVRQLEEEARALERLCDAAMITSVILLGFALFAPAGGRS